MTDGLEVFGIVLRQRFSLPWQSVPAGRPGRVVDEWQAQPAYDPFFFLEKKVHVKVEAC